MNALISFIYGALVKIVDDIYDNNILLKYKYVFVTALLLLTTYIVFFTKDLYILWIIALGIMGSSVGLFHAPLIDILPWKLSLGLYCCRLCTFPLFWQHWMLFHVDFVQDL